MSVLDLTTDLTDQLAQKIRQTYNVPTYAAKPSAGDVTKLASRVFADPGQRLYPCNDKSTTWWSAAYFAQQRDKYAARMADVICERLKAAAEYFAITDDVAALLAVPAQKTAQEQLAALPDSAFAVVYTAEGQTHRFLPMRTDDELKVAAEWLQNNRDTVVYGDRYKVANRIVDAADRLQCDLQQLGEDLAGVVYRTAGLGVASLDTIAQAFNKRASLLQSRVAADQLAADKAAPLIEQLTKCADRLRQQIEIDPTNPDIYPPLVESLEAVDRQFNLPYGAELARPEDTVFALSVKAASEISDNVVALPGVGIYDKADLAGVDAETFTTWFGKEAASDAMDALTGQLDVGRVATFLATLPRPDARQAAQMLTSLDIRPLVDQA